MEPAKGVAADFERKPRRRWRWKTQALPQEVGCSFKPRKNQLSHEFGDAKRPGVGSVTPGSSLLIGCCFPRAGVLLPRTNTDFHSTEYKEHAALDRIRRAPLAGINGENDGRP